LDPQHVFRNFQSAHHRLDYLSQQGSAQGCSWQHIRFESEEIGKALLAEKERKGIEVEQVEEGIEKKVEESVEEEKEVEKVVRAEENGVAMVKPVKKAISAKNGGRKQDKPVMRAQRTNMEARKRKRTF
jgi:ribosomal protein S13